MAEIGLLFQRFAENLTAAIVPKAAAKLELQKTAARDPKRPLKVCEHFQVIGCYAVH
jgi:hypothetical protein